MTLALDNVSKIVGSETHIDNVSLELVEGSFNVLLGRTLSGKTTLMRLMAGRLPTSSTGRHAGGHRDRRELPAVSLEK